MMKDKLDNILLIDDDEATNFIHEIVLKEMDCADSITIFQNGYKALDFLKEKSVNTGKQPDIIFLDINMPGMDGWGFLKEYEKLEPQQKAKVLLIMLSTSLNPDDRERALSIDAVDGFENKLLEESKMKKVLKKYFQKATV